MSIGRVRQRFERMLPGLILVSAVGVAILVLLASWTQPRQFVLTSAVMAVLVILAAAQGVMLWQRVTRRQPGRRPPRGTRVRGRDVPRPRRAAAGGPVHRRLRPGCDVELRQPADRGPPRLQRAEWMADATLWMRQMHPDDRARVQTGGRGGMEPRAGHRERQRVSHGVPRRARGVDPGRGGDHRRRARRALVLPRLHHRHHRPEGRGARPPPERGADAADHRHRQLRLHRAWTATARSPTGTRPRSRRSAGRARRLSASSSRIGSSP